MCWHTWSRYLGSKAAASLTLLCPTHQKPSQFCLYNIPWILALLITSTLAHTVAIFGWDQYNNHLTPLLASAKWCCSCHWSAQNPPPASTLPHSEKRSMSYLSPKALSDLPLGISDHISCTHSVSFDLIGSSPHQASSCLRISALAVNCFPGPLQWRTPWAPAGLYANVTLPVRPSVIILWKRNTNTTASFSPAAFNAFQHTVQLI